MTEAEHIAATAWLPCLTIDSANLAPNKEYQNNTAT